MTIKKLKPPWHLLIPTLVPELFFDFIISVTITTEQKLKFSIKDFFSKFDQIRSFLRIWSHLPKKSLMGNFIFLCNVRSLLSKETSPILFKSMGDSLIVNLIL